MSEGSSARAVPAPTMIASAPARSRCTSARAASPLIHFDEPSRAAALPSSEAAIFSVTWGRPVRTWCSKARFSRPLRGQRAPRDVDPGIARGGRSRAVDERVGIAGGDHRPGHPGGHQGGRKGACGRRGRRARGSVQGRAAGPSRRHGEGDDLGVRVTGPRPRYHPSPTTSPSRTSTAPTRGFGRCGAPPSLGQFEGPVPYAASFVHDVLSGAGGRKRGDARRRAATAPVLSHPDCTVGPGVSPGPPPTGCRGVADCHRRWGIAPRPEDELF